MKLSRRLGAAVVAGLLAGLWSNVGTARDGQHDFDFLRGSWKIHLKRLVHGANGADEWVELDGTTECRPVLDGKAEVEEFNVESRDRKMRIHGLALRFYDPKAGAITFDGVRIADADLAALRGRIALVPQDTAIFATSIASSP